MATQYDVKYSPRARGHQGIGVILGSNVHGATAKDIANLPDAERFFLSIGKGQFVSLSDPQRSVGEQPVSVSGRVVRKDSVKDGDIWHLTVYVK